MPDVNHPTLLVTDQHASVLKVIHAARQHPIAYSPFGHAIHNRQQTLCGFNGQIHEQHTSTYLLGHGYRGLSTRLLRSKGPDSLCPFGAGGLNAYAYCRAEPVNHVDPSGHIPGVLKSSAEILENELFRIDIDEQSAATYRSPTMKTSLKKLKSFDTHLSIRR
jgi:RHS repeat-associated protein